MTLSPLDTLESMAKAKPGIRLKSALYELRKIEVLDALKSPPAEKPLPKLCDIARRFARKVGRHG